MDMEVQARLDENFDTVEETYKKRGLTELLGRIS